MAEGFILKQVSGNSNKEKEYFTCAIYSPIEISESLVVSKEEGDDIE